MLEAWTVSAGLKSHLAAGYSRLSALMNLFTSPQKMCFPLRVVRVVDNISGLHTPGSDSLCQLCLSGTVCIDVQSM